jgi:trans-aconitate methyltransferase
LASFLVPLGEVVDQVADAHRTGEGLAWSHYLAALNDAQAAFNRPAFTHDLEGWLAAVPDVDRAARRPGARILDAACGAGWSTQALARRYPDASVHGVDIDELSIALAMRNLTGSGLEERCGSRYGISPRQARALTTSARCSRPCTT